MHSTSSFSESHSMLLFVWEQIIARTESFYEEFPVKQTNFMHERASLHPQQPEKENFFFSGKGSEMKHRMTIWEFEYRSAAFRLIDHPRCLLAFYIVRCVKKYPQARKSFPHHALERMGWARTRKTDLLALEGFEARRNWNLSAALCTQATNAIRFVNWALN